jgi:hypothetical protein
MNVAAYLKREGASLPPVREGDARYIVAANGLFVERRTAVFSTSARVFERDLALDEHSESCRLHCPRLPRVLHRAMLGFFRAALALHGGEAALVLLYHPERQVYRWHCPEQTVEVVYSRYRQQWVAGDTIRFQHPLSLPGGFLHFGDAHLHLGAPTPSFLDVADDQDGLHVIVGEMMTRPRYNVEFVVDGRRFRLQPESFFDDVDCTPFDRVPPGWIKQIRMERRGEAAEMAGDSVPWYRDYRGSWNSSGWRYGR